MVFKPILMYFVKRWIKAHKSYVRLLVTSTIFSLSHTFPAERKCLKCSVFVIVD